MYAQRGAAMVHLPNGPLFVPLQATPRHPAGPPWSWDITQPQRPGQRRLGSPNAAPAPLQPALTGLARQQRALSVRLVVGRCGRRYWSWRPLLVQPGWPGSPPRVSSRWVVPQVRRQPHSLGPGARRRSAGQCAGCHWIWIYAEREWERYMSVT